MLSVTKHFLLWYHSFFPCYIPDSSDKKNKWCLKIMASKISGCSIITLRSGSKMRKHKQTNKNYWEYKILGFIWCVKLDHHRECLTLVGLVFFNNSSPNFHFLCTLEAIQVNCHESLVDLQWDADEVQRFIYRKQATGSQPTTSFVNYQLLRSNCLARRNVCLYRWTIVC